MALATATPGGAPSVRMVLLKGFDERGLVFFSHYTSRKGRELEANPQAALLFHWSPLGRQVRVEGRVEHVSRGGVGCVLRDAAARRAARCPRLAAERTARFASRAGRAARRAGERPGRRSRAPAADLGRLPARPGGVGVLAAPRRAACTTGSATSGSRRAPGESSGSSPSRDAVNHSGPEVCRPGVDRGAEPRALDLVVGACPLRARQIVRPSLHDRRDRRRASRLRQARGRPATSRARSRTPPSPPGPSRPRASSPRPRLRSACSRRGG